MNFTRDLFRIFNLNFIQAEIILQFTALLPTSIHIHTSTHTDIHTLHEMLATVLDSLNSEILCSCCGQSIHELRSSHLFCHSVYTEAFQEGNSVRGFLQNVQRRLRSRDNFELGEHLLTDLAPYERNKTCKAFIV